MVFLHEIFAFYLLRLTTTHWGNLIFGGKKITKLDFEFSCQKWLILYEFQLFVYISIIISAVCLHFNLEFQLFVYILIIYFSCLFTKSAVCWTDYFLRQKTFKNIQIESKKCVAKMTILSQCVRIIFKETKVVISSVKRASL